RFTSTTRRRLWLGMRVILIVLALIITLLPVYWMVNTSLKTQVEVFTSPPTLWPENPTLANYINLFVRRHLGAYLLNSVIIVGSAVLLSLIIGSLAAYSLARFGKARTQEDVNFWVLAPRIMPPVALVVPMFLILQQLGLIKNIGPTRATGGIMRGARTQKLTFS